MSAHKPVVILTFHHISPYEDSLTVSPELFREVLLYVKEKYNIISYGQFIDHIFNDIKLPKKSVLITLDDGYLDNYLYAFPILKELHIPAVIFLITGMIEHNNHIRTSLPNFIPHKELESNLVKEMFINTAEMDVMQRSGKISFDSHTVNHTDTTSVDEESLKKELNDSLNFIKFYTPTREYYGFCWPKGKFDEKSIKILNESQYSFAFSTIDGAYKKGDDLYTIRRVDISSRGGDDKKYLKRVYRKLFIYSNPILSRLYSNFREYRVNRKKQ